jgi:hypothetical protein
MTYMYTIVSWTNAQVVELLYSVTSHPDDNEKWPKHVDAINSKNIYHLCILLVFINN